jgi:hypothetical protein
MTAQIGQSGRCGTKPAMAGESAALTKTRSNGWLTILNQPIRSGDAHATRLIGEECRIPARARPIQHFHWEYGRRVVLSAEPWHSSGCAASPPALSQPGRSALRRG